MEKEINKYYWIINKNYYEIDGVEIPKGRMARMKKGDRPIINEDWRRATEEEIESKQWYKGNYFNLKYV